MGWQDDPIVAPAPASASNAQRPAWMDDPVVEPAQAPSALERVNAAATGFNSGVAGLLGLPVDTAANVVDLVKAAAGYAYSQATGKAVPDALQIQSRENLPGSGEYIRKALGSAVELPRADDAAQRYIHAAGAGASGALIGPAAGAGVVPSAIGGVSGAVAQQAAAEAGIGPAGQAIAGVVGGGVATGARSASAATTKAAFRGAADRQAVGDTIATFKEAGTTPSVGQVTQGRMQQSAESLLSRTPGASGVMASRAERQASQIGANIEAQAASLAPKSSGEQAGRAIQSGISDAGGFLDTFKGKSAKLYSEIDRHIAPDAPVSVSNTQRALADLTTPTPGAVATSSRLINKRIAELAGDLKIDAQSGTLPYQALRDIRTRIGEEMADAPLKGDVPSAQWKKIYGALSADLAAAAKQAGPDAERAYVRANNYYRAGSQRLEMLQSVLDRNGGPEAVFRAATAGTKEGATTLRAVMQSLPKDQQKVVTATVLRRLGRSKAGAQDDLGEKFSTETFLTNWNTMSPQAKAVLFDRMGPGFRSNMDAVAKVASNLRDGSAVYRNPSGSGQAVAQSTAAATFVLSVLSGNVGTAAAVAGGAGAANLAARLLTKPEFVGWLAKTTKAPASALPAMVTQLAASTDPEIKEFAARLAEQQVKNPSDPRDRER